MKYVRGEPHLTQPVSGRLRLATGVTHVPPWWVCLDVPQGPPHTSRVTCEEHRGSSLRLKVLEEPPTSLVSQGMGLHALALSLPCELLLILQSPQALLQDAPLSPDFSLKQDPVGKVSTPLFGLFYTCLGYRHPPPPLSHETFWQNFCPSGSPSATPQWLALT